MADTPSSETTSVKAQIASLQDAIEKTEKLPYISGTVSVSPKDLVLYYGKGDDLRRLDFSNATDEQLESLAQMCEPATFGRNQEDVLDETYRKAGKLDESCFSTTLDLQSSGIPHILSSRLLSDSSKRVIKAERYKINVHEKDAFFKAHKDTPRGQQMFGSLVIVFPTKHEGGELILRDKGQEWTFNSADAIRNHDAGPCVAYAAFYSDVEHEVRVVTSGYRVTLTYNLYWTTPANLPLHPSDTSRLCDALNVLLENPNFLAKDGYLGFGLQREYPLPQDPGRNVRAYEHLLKGVDAELFAFVQKKGLAPELKLWLCPKQADAWMGPRDWRSDHGFDGVLCQWIPPDFDGDEEGPIYLCLAKEDGQAVLNVRGDGDEISNDGSDKSKGSDGGSNSEDEDEDEDEEKIVPMKVVWASSPPVNQMSYRITQIAYGNEHWLDYEYGRLCLLTKVATFQKRMGLEEEDTESDEDGEEDEGEQGELATEDTDGEQTEREKADGADGGESKG